MNAHRPAGRPARWQFVHVIPAVADFMLDAVEEHAYRHEIVGLAG
jgi:hypothetical protein